MRAVICRGLLVGLMLSIIPPASALAAGITVSPAFQNVVVNQAMSGKDINITYTNQSSLAQTFALTTADFGTLDESGGVALIGTPATELEHRYGLVSWLTLDRNTVVLPPTGSAKISVHIDNRSSLAPGGHYAAVLATAVAEPGAPTGAPRVNFKQVIASLILLRKDGGEEAGLNLVGLSPKSGSWFHLPKSVDLRFRDSGNVHVVPRGTLEIKDPRGKTVSSGIINEDSVFVYPQSFRKMASTLLSLHSAWLPGPYTLTAKYRFDNDNNLGTVSKTFWYMGRLLTWAVIISILIIISGIFWLLRKRRRRK